jgi:hypothetical protein
MANSSVSGVWERERKREEREVGLAIGFVCLWGFEGVGKMIEAIKSENRTL